MFEIENDEAPPAPRGSVPEYKDAATAISKMKPGQSVLLPIKAMPIAHARVVAQRVVRESEGAVQLVTRTVKDGDAEIGLRVHRVSEDAQENASSAKTLARPARKR